MSAPPSYVLFAFWHVQVNVSVIAIKLMIVAGRMSGCEKRSAAGAEQMTTMAESFVEKLIYDGTCHMTHRSVTSC